MNRTKIGMIYDNIDAQIREEKDPKNTTGNLSSIMLEGNKMHLFANKT